MENTTHCRFCADIVSGEIKYIFPPENDDFGEKINTFLPIKVKKTDPLPKQICKICLQSFLQYQKFYFQVLDAEKKLKTIWWQTNISKKSSGQCISCPLCIEGNIGIKDGRILLGDTRRNKTGEEALGHVDNECLTQMIRQELEGEHLKTEEKVVNNGKDVNYEYLCFTCGEGFNKEEEILAHSCIKLLPLDKEKNIKAISKTGKLVNANTDSPAQCEFCGKKYKNIKRLNDHLSFCHPLGSSLM